MVIKVFENVLVWLEISLDVVGGLSLHETDRRTVRSATFRAVAIACRSVIHHFRFSFARVQDGASP